jgi:hypothetical protein
MPRRYRSLLILAAAAAAVLWVMRRQGAAAGVTPPAPLDPTTGQPLEPPPSQRIWDVSAWV